MNKRSSAGLTAKENQAIKAFLDRVHKRFPGQVLQTVLFGSKARGDSQLWSDIDILIIFREESWSLRQKVSIIAADVSLEYDVLVGPRIIGQERWKRMKQHRFSLYRNIVAEGIPLATTPSWS